MRLETSPFVSPLPPPTPFIMSLSNSFLRRISEAFPAPPGCADDDGSPPVVLPGADGASWKEKRLRDRCWARYIKIGHHSAAKDGVEVVMSSAPLLLVEVRTSRHLADIDPSPTRAPMGSLVPAEVDDWDVGLDTE